MCAASKQAEIPGISVTPWTKNVYRDADRFLAESEGLHHALIVHRALSGGLKHIFQPDAVFYVGKSPAAYIKDVSVFSDGDIQKWHRFLWNQAVVPMLIVKSPTSIRVYTACTRPVESEEAVDQLAPLERILETAADAIKYYEELLTSIEAGTFYGENPQLFIQDQAVNDYLLRNLNTAANQLADKLELEKKLAGDEVQERLRFAHEFLTRLLFVCYLIERGMIKGKHFSDGPLAKFCKAGAHEGGYFLRHMFDDLKSDAQKRNRLYELFAHVKTRFNGSLLQGNLRIEKRRISDKCIQIIDDFLQGNDLDSHQLSLGFWAYDFSVIPIELVSSVYEGFLSAQGKIDENAGDTDSRRKTGAYYTPLHLAELTVDIALENIRKPIHELKVLDPACGSGVFLVCVFNRMAQNLKLHKYGERSHRSSRAEKLFGLLSRLYGIDINKTACHISCFGLYLAVLEQLLPIDVEELYQKGKKLPPLLREGASSTGYNTIRCDNLFSPSLSLQDHDFDLVIGNPPWVSREHQTDPQFLSWRERGNPRVRGPERQIAHGFMWKAPKFLSPTGQACLLLPAAVLLNTTTNDFQAEWFGKNAVDRVVNFSDLRLFLFENAIRPCVAVRISQFQSDTQNAAIRYESPKADLRSLQGGPVYIREEDTASIRVKDLLLAARNRQAPLLWKSHMWGSWRDQRLLSRFLAMGKLCDIVGSARKPRRFMKGQGFQRYNPKPTSDIEKIQSKKMPERPWWPPEMLFLSARGMKDLAIAPKDCGAVGNRFPLLLFPRPPALFDGPKVIFTQGSRDMKVAFCGFPVIFQAALQTITGSKGDADLLRFLSVAIKSDLAQYYLFHTSANWGTERDKVHLHELLSLPFVPPEDAAKPRQAQGIVQRVAAAVKRFEEKCNTPDFQLANRQDEAKAIRKKLEPLIRKYYGIDDYESMVIDDTIETIIRSSTPNGPEDVIRTLRSVRDEHCLCYTDTLCEMLSQFTEHKKTTFVGHVFLGRPYSAVRITIGKRKTETKVSKAPKPLAEVLDRMETLLERQNEHFMFCRNMKVFDGDVLYILKPAQRRFWTRTTALNDADEIAAAVIMAKEGRTQW